MNEVQRQRYPYEEQGHYRARRFSSELDEDDEECDEIHNCCDPKKRQKYKACMWTCCKITLITIAVFIVLLLILIFIVLPIAFLCSIGFQRFVMFPNINEPANPEFNNFQKYDINGVRNFYVPVTDIDTNATIYLGVWHLVPDALVNYTIDDSNFNYELELATSGYPVVLYFHGNSGTRIAPLNTYKVLRQFFHVIGFDYRNYGDSTPATLSEPAVVSDSVQLYKWLQSQTTAEIYVWGHSLGTALSTHTVKMLKKEGIIPYGLTLESPFTTMREEITLHPIGRLYSWLPYFQATILDPLERNGFHFKTIENILDVDCPIMIMNAEDDIIIPYTLGYKLAEVARTQRNLAHQGNVTYHQFEYRLGYNHIALTKDPRIPRYISDFMEECKRFWGD